MAKELQALAATGSVVYSQIFRDSDGLIWNTAGTPAFEAYATANIADYDIAMTEAGTASGYFTGDLPTLAAGTYTYVARVRAGGSPAESDSVAGIGRVHWDGSAVVDIATLTARLTSTRAGYLDNLSAGAVATQASVNTIDDFLDTEIAAILEDTGTTIPAQISALNNLSAAQVNAEVDTALADINLDHLVKSAVDTDFATTVHLNSVLGQIADNGTSATFDRTTDSLEAIRDRGDAAWTTGGSSTLTAADVWSYATRVLTAGTNIQLPSNGLANVTAWTVDITGSLSGSVGSVTGAVGSVTGNVGGNIVGSVASVTAITTSSGSVSVYDFTTAAKALLEAEANDALIGQNLDHLMKVAVDTDWATTVHLNSALGHIADNGTSATFDRTTDSLESLRDRGDAAWVTATGFSTHSAADVWSVGTRTITALDEDTTTLDLDATIRAAVGLASANLDTQLTAIDDYLDTEVAAIKAKTDNLPASPAAVGSAMTLTSGERDSIAAALLDLAAGVETNLTPRQLLRLIAAVIAGKSSGGGGTYRDYNDTKNRIVATIDGGNNRTAVTRDVT